MKILAIEASSDACSCALATEGALLERYEVAPRRHTELLLPMVQSLLEARSLALCDLDRIAYGRGPGSFTGVRIAACVAQGLALAAGLEVVPVSSLAALALRAGRPGERVLACLDARMGEVYLCGYRIDGDAQPVPLQEEQLARPEEVDLPGGETWVAAGSGWAVYREVLSARVGSEPSRVHGDLQPAAAQVAHLATCAGAALRPAEAIPGYLRRQVATPRKRPAIPE